MKYTGLGIKKGNANKTYTTDHFSLGIDDEKGPFAEDGAVLDNCVNMVCENGALSTRKGFSANADSVIETQYEERVVYLPFTITETVYYTNSKPYNLAYSCLGDVAMANLRFFLVDSNGNITPAGSIWFNRVDSTTFNIPKNLFFVIAKKTRGIGVYAFIERRNGQDGLFEVYEANENFASWTTAANGYYVPTVRINGRGDRYEEIASRYSLNYPEPERPEELNLLSGKFKCYFTSDGFSAVFRLPFGDIEPASTVTCRLYSNTEDYVEWSFGAYQSYCTRTIDDSDNTLYINRQLGYIRFLGDDGPYDYYVPIMENCPRNNIMVTAQTQQYLAQEEIFTSKAAINLDNRIYFYGNKKSPNCIYCAKSENPLYFPQSSKLFLGDSSNSVTAVKIQNGKLIAFKQGETYRITATSQAEQFEKESVLPERTLYIKGEVLKSQMIDSRIGCSNPDTICLCGNRLVWMASDGEIYALATTTYGNTTNIYRVSRPLGSRLSEKGEQRSGAFAVTDNGKYILVLGDCAFVMNYKVRGFGYSRAYYAGDDKIKSPAWYIWTMPENSGIYGGTVIGGEAVLYSKFEDVLYYYTVTLNGNADTALSIDDGQTVTLSSPIHSGFTTKAFDFGSAHRLKRLDCVFINGECKNNAVLTLADGINKFSRHVSFKDAGDSLRIDACMPACRTVTAGIYSKKPFSINSIVFKYKLLADKG